MATQALPKRKASEGTQSEECLTNETKKEKKRRKRHKKIQSGLQNTFSAGRIQEGAVALDLSMLQQSSPSVYFNSSHQADRDLTLCVLSAFRALFCQELSPVRVLDAFAGTAIRSFRILKELMGSWEVVANDVSAAAIACIRQNATLMKAPVHVVEGDVVELLQTCNTPFDVIDLDPFGSCASFLEAAVHPRALRSGGLLCVTTFDVHDLTGGYRRSGSSEGPRTAASSAPSVTSLSHACQVKWGGAPLRTSSCPEGAIRLVLRALHDAVAPVGRRIQPLLSVSLDFCFRIFVLVLDNDVKGISQPHVLTPQYCAKCELTSLDPVPSNQCPWCEEPQTLRVAGPMWSGLIHSKDFVDAVRTVVSPALPAGMSVSASAPEPRLVLDSRHWVVGLLDDVAAECAAAARFPLYTSVMQEYAIISKRNSLESKSSSAPQLGRAGRRLLKRTVTAQLQSENIPYGPTALNRDGVKTSADGIQTRSIISGAVTRLLESKDIQSMKMQLNADCSEDSCFPDAEVRLVETTEQHTLAESSLISPALLDAVAAAKQRSNAFTLVPESSGAALQGSVICSRGGVQHVHLSLDDAFGQCSAAAENESVWYLQVCGVVLLEQRVLIQSNVVLRGSSAAAAIKVRPTASVSVGNGGKLCVSHLRVCVHDIPSDNSDARHEEVKQEQRPVKHLLCSQRAGLLYMSDVKLSCGQRSSGVTAADGGLLALENVSIAGQEVRRGDPRQRGVLVTGTSLALLDRVSIQCTGGPCVDVCGGSSAWLLDCALTRGARSGVYASKGSVVSCVRSVISHSGWAGVEVCGPASVFCDNSRIEHAGRGGALVLSGGTLELTQTSIVESQMAGIDARGSSLVRMSGCTCSQGQGRGVFVHERSFLWAEETELSHNRGHGIFVDTGGRVCWKGDTGAMSNKKGFANMTVRVVQS